MIKTALAVGVTLLIALIGFTMYNKTNNQTPSYSQITPLEAKTLMDNKQGYIILDVRTKSEYEVSHISGAVLIPVDEIEEQAPNVLTDKNQLILVYCRSGRRSQAAAKKLINLGYTNVKDFGGITNWPYETE